MIIQAQKQLKVLLIGDSCQDIYHFGSCDRISPEAPVLILKENRIETTTITTCVMIWNAATCHCVVKKIAIQKIRWIKKKRYNCHSNRSWYRKNKTNCTITKCKK